MLGGGSFFGALADVVSKYVFGHPPLHWVSILFAVIGIVAGFFLARSQRAKHKVINNAAAGSKILSNEFSVEEERAFQDHVDSMHIGNDHAKVSDARDLWNAGKAFAANEACQSNGLFKVVHGPLGTDGLPIRVQIESLGDWDIENIADGTILYAAPFKTQE